MNKGTNVDGNVSANRDFIGRDFIQNIRNTDTDIDPDDLATLLSLALFGNSKLKFNGLIAEVEEIKKQLNEVKQSQLRREEIETTITNRLAKLEKSIPTLHYTLNQKIFLIIVLIASLTIIFYVASQIFTKF